MNDILISIADCNHGFFEPEMEECCRLSKKHKAKIEVRFVDCEEDQVVTKCRGSQVIVVQRTNVTGSMMKQIPECKIVVRLGVGLDNINVDEMDEIGIEVISFPGFCTEEVANSALAMILSTYRRLGLIRDNQKSLGNFWGQPVLLNGLKRADRTVVGVLGAGRIGSEVIRRLNVCGFRVLVCDPYVVRKDQETVDIDVLFKESDIVTIHCSLIDETKYMVDYELLKTMKPGSCLVNTARGSVIVSDDLVRVLSENHLRAAYVDVYDPEPADAQSLSHDRLYITPHTAFYSQDSLDWLKRETIKQSVKAFYEVQSNSHKLS